MSLLFVYNLFIVSFALKCYIIISLMKTVMNMVCKKCGAPLNENDKICPRCGTFTDGDEGYVLLTSYDRAEEPEVQEEAVAIVEEKPPSRLLGFLKLLLIAVLVAAVSGGAAYAYMTYFRPKMQQTPEVTFTTGSGIINGDMPVIYAAINGATDIEFIHGVSVYDCDITDAQNENAEPLSTDYEYTKNINSTFRCIFFDMSDIKLKKDKNYTYSFRMKFSFEGSDAVYSYTEVIPFTGTITEDASDTVFDHSVKQSITLPEETQPESTTAAPNETQTENASDYSFIYQGYWFTAPQTQNDVRTIESIQFSQDLTYRRTNFEKQGDADWRVTTDGGIFTLRDGYVVLSSGAGTEEVYLKADTAAGTLTEERDGTAYAELTNRRYNSTKNAEDFFGI